METVPESLQVVFSAWSAGFGETVFPKFVTLLLGAVLTTGRHTVSQVVRVVGELADADPSSYHRVLSMRRWSMWSLARPLVVCVLDTLLPRGIVLLCQDSRRGCPVDQLRHGDLRVTVRILNQSRLIFLEFI